MTQKTSAEVSEHASESDNISEGNSLPFKKSRRTRGKGLSVREMTVFALLAAILFCSKLLLEWAPNIHLLAPLLMSFAVVYRAKAFIPLYLFVFLLGLVNGFNVWWIPYLYIWLPLMLAALLLPRRMPPKLAVPVYMLLGTLHGALYGILYAPAQALFFRMDLEMTVAWIVTGLPFDLLHAAGNLAASALTLPLIRLLARLEKRHSA